MQRFYYKTWIMTLKVIYIAILEKVVAPKESAEEVVTIAELYYIAICYSIFIVP